jgi:hypothetical protein
MAPWADHALGDPALDASAPLGPLSTAPNQTGAGVLGNIGHGNSSSTPVFQQIKAVKDTPLGNSANATDRYFDSLLLADAVQEFPPNPFITARGTNARVRMRNIFRFAIDMTTFDPNAGWVGGYSVGLNTVVGGTVGSAGGVATPDPTDTGRVFLMNHFPSLASFQPPAFSDSCSFGTGEDDFFAQGDFAYVPVLSSSSQPFGDSAATLENELYRWGTTVDGYLLFGYGDRSHKTKEFEDEQRDFVANGLPGMGGVGADTPYEAVVVQLFEGAIFFSNKK